MSYIEPGESYDQYLEQLVVNSSNLAATTAYDGYSQTAVTTITQPIDKHANSDNVSVSKYSIQSSESSSLSDSSSIAPPAEAPKASTPSIAAETNATATPSPEAVAPPAMAQESLPITGTDTNAMGYVTKKSNKHLYKRQESKIAVAQEGSNYHHTANIATTMAPKVAADPYRSNSYGYNQTNFYSPNYYHNYSYGEISKSSSNSRVAQAPIAQVQFIYCRT